MSLLPLSRPHALGAQPHESRWLVEELWSERAVGIVGGEPKCCKSFLALDLAVAVASGAPCLRRFHVTQAGPVLLYAAEDALHVVRHRLHGIANAAGVDFEALDIQVITAPTLRLDRAADQERLAKTVETVRPRLLVLDPFVRLHRIDENVAAEVAPLLAYLRTLERCYEVSVLLVHHARKGGGRVRAGQALRGSSELHAWGDSNLYLRRTETALLLSVEHRAAKAIDQLTLELRSSGDALALHIAEHAPAAGAAPISTPADRVLRALGSSSAALSREQIRRTCRLRTATLGTTLRTMEKQGSIVRAANGYRLPCASSTVSLSQSPLHIAGNGNGKHSITNELPGETEAGSAEEQPAKG